MRPPLSILLIDDDAGHRELISRALLADGRPLCIDAVANCSDALAALSTERFDLVLTDFNLDDGEADTLLCFIRKHRLGCPTVVISGSDEQDIVVRSMRSGSFDFLHKNDAIDPAKLWRRLDAVIGQHRGMQCERRKMERRVRRLEQLATRDPLTGLSNRRAVESILTGNGRRTLDRRGEVVLAMLDIDHFKRINDTFGHQCGDRVLRTIARLMKRMAKRNDIVARWGGEEILVCRLNSNLAAGICWAEEIRAAIEKLKLPWDDQLVPVTVSIGVHAEPCHDSIQSALSHADHALYYAKQRGRNRVRTSRHALFADLIGRVTTGEPQRRFDALLDEAREQLGPTQREHLTEHSRRVSELVSHVAAVLGLNDDLREHLRLAGRLHDIGKFCVPENVLNKSSTLHETERKLLNRHAADGGEMAEIMGVERTIAGFVRRHHDRFDAPSSGNDPRPVDRTEALGGHVIHVADALVTMTSERSYKATRSLPEALAELRQESGRQFSPDVVDAAIRVADRRSTSPATCTVTD
ncbi:MAG: diguanylate cyclase [Phycisphaerales bacterium]|nr:diguanylate cyclase [Phycisphaerales bacterium]